MASKQPIDTISYGGQTYEFQDASARNSIQTLSQRVTNLNNSQTEAVNAEKTRAEAAEQALETSKVSYVAGKGLSTNDFTNEYKEMLDNPSVFEGATDEDDGSQGDVPAPEAGDEEKFLCGDGTWKEVPVPEYEDATHSTHGLMSALDKLKLDGIDPELEEWQSSSTTFNNNVITETLGNGRTKTTTFNNNGTITQVITQTGRSTITLTTTFNNDGSITRTRTTT